MKALAWGISWLGWLIIQFICKTSRITTRHHPEAIHLIHQKKPVIFALWHRYQLLMVYEHRGSGANVLVSQSKDGELIAQALHRFGFKTVRGSSSRGGSAAFFEMLCRVERGEQAAFTPDGPRGPYRGVGPGVAALAQKTGVPIIPVGWTGTKVRELSSWDRFLIPLPFARYVVYFDAPLYLTEGLADADGAVQRALDAAVDESGRLLRA